MVTMYVTPSQQAAARLILKLGNRRQRFDPQMLHAIANAPRASKNGGPPDEEGRTPPTVRTEG